MVKKSEKTAFKKKHDEVAWVTRQKVIHLKERTKFQLSTLVSTRKRRILTSILGALLVVSLLLAIPATRYFLLGSVIKKDIVITVVDSKSQKPVSDASVQMGSSIAQTDKNGNVTLKAISVGTPQLKVTKKNYESYSSEYTVPILSKNVSPRVELVATGRQVLVSIINKITKQSLSDAVISSNDAKATTDSLGAAALVLPSDSMAGKATITKNGYNTVEVDLPVAETDTEVTFEITPIGSIYYLSKATGNINVMKSDIDGTNPSVVVEGTGRESDNSTTLLSARDWRYSVLLATRTDDKERLYLIDSIKNDFTVLDEGNATFSPVGWSGHSFIYTVSRKGGNYWDDKKYALKSFNADTRRITILDQTAGAGTSYYDNAYEYFSGIYILNDELVYLKSWGLGTYNEPTPVRDAQLVSINLSSNTKKTIKTYPYKASASIKLYEPQGVYIRTRIGEDPAVFYEYEDKTIKSVDNTSDAKFYGFYPTYLISPSGKKSLWYEQRDGKNIVFIGDTEGRGAKTISNSSEYIPYGWYGGDDEYILLTKNGSELYILPAGVTIGQDGNVPLKVTDYHKTRTYPGYGYGYGGQ